MVVLTEIQKGNDNNPKECCGSSHVTNQKEKDKECYLWLFWHVCRKPLSTPVQCVEGLQIQGTWRKRLNDVGKSWSSTKLSLP